jgi:hypothetical protein
MKKNELGLAENCKNRKLKHDYKLVWSMTDSLRNSVKSTCFRECLNVGIDDEERKAAGRAFHTSTLRIKRLDRSRFVA